MRDAFIQGVYERMHRDERIFFLSADFGAPALDLLRKDFADRFINVGIAEQNLVNVSTGLALEGFTIYAYAIAGFLTMRAYEQIRTSLALLSQQRPLNVNLVGVGTGVSYEMSGPSHHCLEDLTIMRALPHITIFSPSDWIIAKGFVEFSVGVNTPKYIRLDSKPLPQIYEANTQFKWAEGFCELRRGDDCCIVSTGWATHTALAAARKLETQGKNAGVIDVFMIKPLDEAVLFDSLKNYKTVVTVEEAFSNKGGLDCLISSVLRHRNSHMRLINLGFADTYVFERGDRAHLAKLNNCSEEDIVRTVNAADTQL
jgi:transketolase